MDGGPAAIRSVGLVGPDADALADRLDAADSPLTPGSPAAVLEAGVDAVVAVGEPSLLSLVRREPTVPVLPVDAGRGVRSVPRDALAAAVAALRDGDWSVDTHPRLTVCVDGDPVSSGLCDVTLVTAEPAHISEFGVECADEAVAVFRADGVVAATPAGSSGYARSAGGPVIPPGPALLAVVPIAPFATTLDDWVLPADGVRLTVEREEADVDLQVDDRTVREVAMGEVVEIDATGTVDLLVVPQSTTPFRGGDGKLEKL